jgi:hypothetical protein
MATHLNLIRFPITRDGMEKPHDRCKSFLLFHARVVVFEIVVELNAFLLYNGTLNIFYDEMCAPFHFNHNNLSLFFLFFPCKTFR